MKKYIFVLHNGRVGGEISVECARRMRAAHQLIMHDAKSYTIVFVGGGCMKPESGASTMATWWSKQYGQSAHDIFVCDTSNNTAMNVQEICDIVRKEKITQIIVVSNAFHVPRLRLFTRSRRCVMDIVAAEDVLHEKCGDIMAMIMEPFLYLLALVDRKQRIVYLWRKILRR